jgi:hypothetical protein
VTKGKQCTTYCKAKVLSPVRRQYTEARLDLAVAAAEAVSCSEDDTRTGAR